MKCPEHLANPVDEAKISCMHAKEEGRKATAHPSKLAGAAAAAAFVDSRIFFSSPLHTSYYYYYYRVELQFAYTLLY